MMTKTYVPSVKISISFPTLKEFVYSALGNSVTNVKKLEYAQFIEHALMQMICPTLQLLNASIVRLMTAYSVPMITNVRCAMNH